MNKTKQLMQWVEQGALKVEDLPEALRLTQAVPNGQQQHNFLSGFLLITGALLLVSGVIFFFAFNWDELHRFAKFAIVQSALLLCLLPLIKVPATHPVGQVSVGVASLMLGACLALVGQTYQTGADTYQLFLVWALLLLPWLLITQQVFIGALIIVLANVSWWLYSTLFSGFGSDYLIYGMILLNAIVWLLLETYQQLRTKRLLSVVITAVFAWLIWLTSWLVITNIGRAGHSMPSFIIGCVLVGSSFYFYRYRQLNVLHLAILALSVIAYITAFVAEHLNLNMFHEFGMLLLAGLFMGLSVGAANYLKRLYQLQEQGVNHE